MNDEQERYLKNEYTKTSKKIAIVFGAITLIGIALVILSLTGVI